MIYPEKDECEVAGILIKKGDPVFVDGFRGSFKFISYTKTESGAEWITVWHEGRQYRNFRPDKISTKKKSKAVKQRKIREDAICNEHPLYTAQRRPRTSCSICWAAYEDRKARKNERVIRN